MFHSSNIRLLQPSDLPKLRVILDQTELFPSDLLAEMVRPFFEDPTCKEFWNVYEHDGDVVAFTYCVQEKMTDGTWNILAIAVAPSHQGCSIGKRLMYYNERLLAERQQSILLVEASSLPEYARTRRFYQGIGFHLEAVIRDFYSEGEDKVVFWKRLG